MSEKGRSEEDSGGKLLEFSMIERAGTASILKRRCSTSRVFAIAVYSTCDELGVEATAPTAAKQEEKRVMIG